MYLPMPGTARRRPTFSIRSSITSNGWSWTNRAPYPVERTLLTSGMTLAGVESLHRDGALIETPQMEVRYTAPQESLFWKE